MLATVTTPRRGALASPEVWRAGGTGCGSPLHVTGWARQQHPAPVSTWGPRRPGAPGCVPQEARPLLPAGCSGLWGPAVTRLLILLLVQGSSEIRGGHFWVGSSMQCLVCLVLGQDWRPGSPGFSVNVAVHPSSVHSCLREPQSRSEGIGHCLQGAGGASHPPPHPPPRDSPLLPMLLWAFTHCPTCPLPSAQPRPDWDLVLSFPDHLLYFPQK